MRSRLVGNLSKGYRQRVGFAQALIGRPPLLVLDEPTVGLDPQQIIELRELIVRLKEDHTVILSSHILSEIAVTCDRIVVLSNGRLVADDTLEGLVRRASEKRGTILQADGEEAQLLPLLSSVAGVNGVSVQLSDSNGEKEYHLDTLPGADIHKELFEKLAAAGCAIRQLRPAEASLEDVFLKLTRDRRYENTEKEAE